MRLFYFGLFSFFIFLLYKVRKAYKRYTSTDFDFHFSEDEKKELQESLDKPYNAKVISLEEFKEKMKWN